MNTDILKLSGEFQRLYCDASVYEDFSALHPISFRRVLPFQAQDAVVDDAGLIGAEEAHLATRNDQTRLAVVEAYCRCGLLPEALIRRGYVAEAKLLLYEAAMLEPNADFVRERIKGLK